MATCAKRRPFHNVDDHDDVLWLTCDLPAGTHRVHHDPVHDAEWRE